MRHIHYAADRTPGEGTLVVCPRCGDRFNLDARVPIGRDVPTPPDRPPCAREPLARYDP